MAHRIAHGLDDDGERLFGEVLVDGAQRSRHAHCRLDVAVVGEFGDGGVHLLTKVARGSGGVQGKDRVANLFDGGLQVIDVTVEAFDDLG